MITVNRGILCVTLICFTGVLSCNRDQDDLEKLYCIQNSEQFYGAWGIIGPSLPCPYTESDQRNARLIFTDGTSLDILPGPYGNGGIFLQNVSCDQTKTGGMITYIIIRWSVDFKSGSSVFTYPIFSCDAGTDKKITLVDSKGNYHLLYTTTTYFIYFNDGSHVEKEIKVIQIM